MMTQNQKLTTLETCSARSIRALISSSVSWLVLVWVNKYEACVRGASFLAMKCPRRLSIVNMVRISSSVASWKCHLSVRRQRAYCKKRSRLALRANRYVSASSSTASLISIPPLAILEDNPLRRTHRLHGVERRSELINPHLLPLSQLLLVCEDTRLQLHYFPLLHSTGCADVLIDLVAVVVSVWMCAFVAMPLHPLAQALFRSATNVVVVVGWILRIL